MSLNQQKYSLDNLRLFPFYQSRKAYLEATGKEPPPFNPTRPPQRWEDPAALTSKARVITYQNTLAVSEYDPEKPGGNGGIPLADANGRPFFQPLVMLKTEAGSVNIPNYEAANEPGTEQPEVQPPLRALEANEELIFDGIGNLVLVHNTDFPFDAIPVGGFTQQDRDLLKRIATKIGA